MFVVLGFAEVADDIIHNLFFHDLRAVPGPQLARATRFYEAYFEICKSPGGQYFRQIDLLHDVYGPIVRVTPHEVHIRDFAFHEVLYAFNAKRDRDSEYSNRFGAPLSLLGTRYHDTSRIRRLAANPFFSRASITALEPVIQAKVQQLCDNIGKIGRNNGLILMKDAMVTVTVDILSEHCFSRSIGALKSLDCSPQWEEMMGGLTGAVPFAKSIPGFVTLVQLLPLWVDRRMSPIMGAYFDYVEIIRQQVIATIQEVKNKPEVPKFYSARLNIFQELLSSDLPAEEKTEEQLVQEGFGLVGAAAETTSSTLAAIIFHVVHTPGLSVRLRNELKAVTMKDTKLSWKVFESLPLLTAIIEEGLRWRTTLSGRQPMIAREDLRYGDLVIPAGNIISMSCRDALCDPDIFPSPDYFQPKRWLVGVSDAQKKRMEQAFIPFNKGPRTCIGFHLAYCNMYHVLAALFSRFEFELVDTILERDVAIHMDLFVAKPAPGSTGVKVRVLRDYTTD